MSITQTQEWQALARHADEMRDVHLRELFAADADARRDATPSRPPTCSPTTPSSGSPTRRCACCSRSPSGPGCASASTRCSPASRSTPPRTAPCCTSPCGRRADEQIEVDGDDVVPEVHEVLDRMGEFAGKVRSGRLAGRHRRSASATSSTSASAAPTSARRWPTTRCSTRPTASSTCRFVTNVDGDDVGRGDPRPRPGRDAVHRRVQDVHHHRDAHQRPHRPPVAGRRARRGRRREALRRRVDQRRQGDEVRHRHGQHVRVLGLGRRPLLLRLGDRAVADDRHRPGELPRDAGRLPRHRRALPHHAVRAEPAGAAGPARRLVRRLLRRADPRRAALQRLPRAAADLPAAARHGEQRQVGDPRRRAGRLPDRPDRLGHARHQRPARLLPADPPGHEADPGRLHRLPRARTTHDGAAARTTTC